jgi:type IV secretory pathway ATPase VirB11/archaellum biosynthesis ATPase
MESYLNSQNIIRKYLKKDILGEPLLYQPYLTSIMHNPYGNLPVSTWFLVNDSMLMHGIIFEWSKDLKKISKENILGEPLLYQPYLTSIMHNLYGNLPVSTWLLVN